MTGHTGGHMTSEARGVLARRATACGIRAQTVPDPSAQSTNPHSAEASNSTATGAT